MIMEGSLFVVAVAWLQVLLHLGQGKLESLYSWEKKSAPSPFVACDREEAG